MFIYKTTNLINGKIYVGQHISNDKNYFGSGSTLKKAIKKYGKHNFKREILELCYNKEQLDEREIFWIKELNSSDRLVGYNIRSGGGLNGGDLDISGEKNPMYGKTHTDAVKKKISELHSKSYDERFGKEKSSEIRKKNE